MELPLVKQQYVLVFFGKIVLVFCVTALAKKV